MKKKMLSLLLALALCLGLAVPALAVESGDDAPEKQLWLQWASYDWDAGYYAPSGGEVNSSFQPHPGDYYDLLFGTVEFDENGEAILESFQPVPAEELTFSAGVELWTDFDGSLAEDDPYAGCYVEVAVEEWEQDYWVRWNDYVMYFNSNLPDFGLYTAPKATPENYTDSFPHSYFGSAVCYVGAACTDETYGFHLVSATTVDEDGAPLGDNDLFTLEKVNENFWKVQVLPEAREQECVRIVFSLCFADADGNKWTNQWELESWENIALLWSQEPLFQTMTDEAVPFADVKDKLSNTLTLTVGEKTRFYANQLFRDETGEMMVSSAYSYTLAPEREGLEVVYQDDMTYDVKPVEVCATAPGENAVYWSYIQYCGFAEDGTETPLGQGFDEEAGERVYFVLETGEPYQGQMVRRPSLRSVGYVPIRVTATVLNPTAIASTQSVALDDQDVIFHTYQIDGANYVKLRDMANALNGTAAQFEVGYDNATGRITLTTGQGYTAVGGEMAQNAAGEQSYHACRSVIELNGEVVQLEAYTINGNNFFKLRDLGRALGFNVSYIDGRVVVNSSEPYSDAQ